MRFLILGATGMAGHLTAAYLLEHGHDVFGSYRRETAVLELLRGMGMKAVHFDAMDPTQLPSVVRPKDYDAVVNCIGMLNRTCDEHPERAVRLNALLPHRLEALTTRTSCRIVHLSTDCVFAGNTGPYRENAEPDGLTLYDLTKASGELHNDKDLTLRQSIVGPDPNPEGIGLLNWFMAQSGSIAGYSHAMWTGLTTLELAKAIESFVEEGLYGLVNMVPNENISKFDLLRLFNCGFREGSLEIKESDKVVLDKTLIRRDEALAFTPACYEKQIDELVDWVASHRNFYPHYFERCVD